MATIPQRNLDRPPLKAIQVELPEPLVRQAKMTVAATGSTLRELIKTALEQYLGSDEGKAA